MKKYLLLTVCISFFYLNDSIAQSDYSAQYSHDGEKILFYSYRIKKEPEIFVIDKNGENLKQITKTDGNWSIEPRWAYRGNLIAYSSGPNMGSLKINVHNLDNNQAQSVENMDGSQFIISWNRYGLQWGNKSKEGFKFYLKTGKGNKALKYDQFKNYFIKTSKNGLYTIISVYDEEQDKKGLWLAIGLDQPKKLTKQTGSNIAFSSDGKFIAFESKGKEAINIYTINLDGSQLKQITSEKANDMMPTISPDGKNITFTSSLTGKYCLHTINLESKKITQITGK